MSESPGQRFRRRLAHPHNIGFTRRLILFELRDAAIERPDHGPRTRPAHSCNQPALFEFGNPRTLAINLPCSSLERDFCRQRLAHQNGPEDDVSAQRPAIGDHHAREMAAKAAFLLASYQLRVSGDWVVADAAPAKPVSFGTTGKNTG
jgi:hypothetical protein